MARRRWIATVATGLAVAGAGLLGACTEDPGSKSAFCDQVAKVPSLEAVLARFSETDPTVLDERIDNARAAYADLAAAAPSAIDSETDDVVGLVDDILDAVEDNPDDPAKAAEQLRAAMDDHPDVDAAQEAVTTYALDECGVRLDATLGNDSDSTTTTTTVPITSTTTG